MESVLYSCPLYENSSHLDFSLHLPPKDNCPLLDNVCLGEIPLFVLKEEFMIIVHMYFPIIVIIIVWTPK